MTSSLVFHQWQAVYVERLTGHYYRILQPRSCIDTPKRDPAALESNSL